MPSSTSLAPARAAPGVEGPTRLLVAWQHPQTRAIALVGTLEYTSGRYTFRYLASALDTVGFRSFLGFDDLHRRYVSEHLFALFRQRLMDHDRPDFRGYLDTLGLAEGSSPLAVLGRSGGSRTGDSIFLLHEPEVYDDGGTHTTFFVHGVRHQEGAAERIARLSVGEGLLLRREPQNEFNPRAVLVTAEDERALGWVPDVLTDYVQEALSVAEPRVQVTKVNDWHTPPNLRMLVRLAGRVRPGYRPFSGREYVPLA